MVKVTMVSLMIAEKEAKTTTTFQNKDIEIQSLIAACKAQHYLLNISMHYSSRM
jgi:hypothetical protein